MLADRPSERVVILLGTSRIVGHVHDDEGRPVAGKWVEVSTSENLGAHGAFFTGRRTDEQGAFAIDQLTSDFYWLTLRSNPWHMEDELMQRVSRLAEGETRVIDIGRPARATVWSGTVRARTGDFVPGPGQIAVDDTVTQAHREVPFDERGRFSVALQPGTYEVRVVQASLHHDAKLPPVPISETDVELDLVVPGTRLRGRVRERGGVPWSYATAVVEVRIHREGHDYSSAYRQTDAAEDGSFVFDGLEPGAWLLDTRFARIAGNTRLEVPGQGVRDHRFTVLEDELEVFLDFELGAP